MAVLIDGKKISAQVKDECKERVAKENMDVTLAVIQVRNDPASTVYVGNKKKACEYVGIHSLSYELSEETTEEESKNGFSHLTPQIVGTITTAFPY